MKLFLVLATYLLWLRGQHCAPYVAEVTPNETLKRLSKTGEEFIEREIKEAMAGVENMKVILERNEGKHDYLMKSLQRSKEEKEEALHLMEEIQDRLKEAEGQCESTLEGAWERCKPCLESSCFIFYMTNCHQGFSLFTSEVEDFFQALSSVAFDPEGAVGHSVGFDEEMNDEDALLKQIENWFDQLTSDVRTMFNQSIVVFNMMQEDFDQQFHEYVSYDSSTPQSDVAPLIIVDSVREDDDGFLQGLQLPGFLQTLVDFSSDICERVLSSWEGILYKIQDATKDLFSQIKGSESSFASMMPSHEPALCKEIPQNISGCRLFEERCQQCKDAILKECPNISDLQLKSDEARKLMNRSDEQYHQILQIAQDYAEDISGLIYEMKKRFGWVSELVNTTTGPGHIFNIVKVSSSPNDGDVTKVNETIVEVNILSSSVFAVRVPPDLDIENPQFIEHVAGKALQLFKNNLQGHQ